MKKALLVACTIVLLASVSAYARIGETLEQCIERYGDPLKNDSSNAMFSKAGVYVYAHFFEGKADMITFRKIEEDVLERPVELSQTEINVLLSSNGQGHEWAKQNSPSMDSDWKTDDGKVLAHYTFMDHVLIVATAEYMARAAAAKDAEEKEKLNSF